MLGWARCPFFFSVLGGVLIFSVSCGDKTKPLAKPALQRPDAAASGETKAGAPAEEPVEFTTEDGVVLRGVLFASTARQKDRKRADGVIILVHQLSTDRSEWKPFIEALVPTHSVLAIDMRGHGESNADTQGESLVWDEFSNDDWSKLSLDVRAAVSYVRDLSPSPLAISLAGSSIGSSAVLQYAAEDSSIHSVALLSPGLRYRGLATEKPAKLLKSRPVFIRASKGDKASANAAEALAKASGSQRIKIYPGSGHGVSMEGPVVNDTVAFLRETPTYDGPGTDSLSE